MNPWIRSSRPLVIAHRGYSQIAPENTLPAYQKALDVGADMIEADVNITRDGVLVMMHDYFLDRTINSTGNVADHTYDEICTLDAGVKFHTAFAGTRIPTTEATIRLAKDNGVSICFEIKGGEPTRACLIAEKLMRLFDKYDAYEWALISSYFSEASALAKRISPQLQVVREWLPDDAPINFEEAMSQVGELSSPILLFDFAHLTEDVVPFFHAHDVALWTWNPHMQEDLERVINMGVDGVMGDNPELAAQLVRRSSHHVGMARDQ